MIGYILTLEQKNAIQGKFYSEWQVFSCALDINNIWFIVLSQQDETEIINTQYNWILNLKKGEFIPPVNPYL